MTERKLESTQVYRGKLLTVRVDRVRLDSGRESTREVVEHPGAVAILPVMENGDFALVRQFRYAVGRELLEVPAGTREPDETPEETAVRELREEVGLEASVVEPLARYFISPGWCGEELFAFRAIGLQEVSAAPELDENIEVARVSPAEALDLMRRGIIADAKTITTILLHLHSEA